MIEEECLLLQNCVLFVVNVKAKVFMEYSAGFPCYSLLHTFELEAEEYMVDIFNDKPLVRNEVSIWHEMLVSCPASQACGEICRVQICGARDCGKRC